MGVVKQTLDVVKQYLLRKNTLKDNREKLQNEHRKVLVEYSKDKLAEDNKDLDKLKTITECKSAKEMAEKSKKELQERNKKLKKDVAKVVATGAMIIMLVMGGKYIQKNKNNGEVDFKEKPPVYSVKIPGEQVQDGTTGEQPENTKNVEEVNKGGSGGSGQAFNPTEKIDVNNTVEDTLGNNNAELDVGNSQDASLQTKESIQANKDQQKEIDNRQQNADDKIQQQGKGSSTIKTENRDEINKFNEKNTKDHSYRENYNKDKGAGYSGELSLNQDQEPKQEQTFKEVKSDEQKQRENKANEQAPAPKVKEENLQQSSDDKLRAVYESFASKEAKQVKDAEGPSR